MSFPCLKTFNGPHFPKGKITFQTSSPTIPYPLPFPRLQVLAHAVHSAYNSPLRSWVSKIPFIMQDSLSSLRSSNSKHTPLPFTEQVPCCAPFLWQQLWHWLVLNYLCICLVSPTWPRSPWRQGPYAAWPAGHIGECGILPFTGWTNGREGWNTRGVDHQMQIMHS